jgi:hypothetical protein
MSEENVATTARVIEAFNRGGVEEVPEQELETAGHSVRWPTANPGAAALPHVRCARVD